MLAAMEIVVELVLNIVGEILVEAVFEAFGWTLRQRWGRLILGTLGGFGGGLLWATVVTTAAPALATGRWVGWALSAS